MPGEVDEKSPHIKYLKEFRTLQCPDFLQHKCSHHRPYNCFNWHFVNQKRRRPFKKKDGAFNYNPDLYCSQYDETTGVCLYGDECHLLHRVAGDVERRYHPRYFKTCICVHETDTKGHCVKNGPHCAYAHGPDDLRFPVFDCSEDPSMPPSSHSSTNLLASHLEKDILQNEDPVWNDPHYVLINYKTEQCLRPHRLCRQGYACPSFHNPRDKRRSPKMHKYRSTPCPNVKRGDEWGDPPLCDAGDACSYCHTRTEQQFHPEIYKSTKCNDMVQSGYCPRGQFCAFAHLERELSESWDVFSTSEACIADYVEAVLPTSGNLQPLQDDSCNGGSGIKSADDYCVVRKTSLPVEPNATAERLNEDVFNAPPASLSYKPEAIGKRRTMSLCEGSARYPGTNLGTLHERHAHPYIPHQSYYMPSNTTESTKESINQWNYYNNNNNNSNNNNTNNINNIYYEKMLNHPPEDTVESVIVNALEGDVGELNLKEDRESPSGNFQYGTYFRGASRPMEIPNNNANVLNNNNASLLNNNNASLLNNNNASLLNNNNASLLNNNSSISQGEQKECVDGFQYGQSYPLLAPIGSEHAASMLFNKHQHIQTSTSTLTERPLNFQAAINNTFFPSGSLPLSPGNMMDGAEVIDVLKNENNILRMELNDTQTDRENMMRKMEQLSNENVFMCKDREAVIHKYNSLATELSVLKSSLGGQVLLPPILQQTSHSNDALIFKDVQELAMDPNMTPYPVSSMDVCASCKQHSDNMVPLSCSKCFTCANCYTGTASCFNCPQGLTS